MGVICQGTNSVSRFVYNGAEIAEDKERSDTTSDPVYRFPDDGRLTETLSDCTQQRDYK